MTGPAAEPIRRPFGVAPVRTRHVLRRRAVLAADVAALVNCDALTTMEHLDHACGDAHLDFGADEGVRDRVEKVMDLDVIIERRARARAGLTRARRHSANSQSWVGSGVRASRSIFSNSSRRLRPR